MSMRATLKKAARTAFYATGDVVEQVTWRESTSDYSTGEVVSSALDHDVDMIFTRFELREIDKVVIQTNDVKGIVLVEKMPHAPNPSRNTVIRDNKEYAVIAYTTDPSESIYIIQLRAP